MIHDLYRLVSWTWGGTSFHNPLTGYNILSGPFPDLVYIAAAFHFYTRHNCHVTGCHRIGRLDPLHGHPACKRHHSKKHLLGEDPHVRRADVRLEPDDL